MGFFIYNGKILKDGAAIAGADNRGLRYGDGVFETIKMLDGKLLLANEHFARLWKGMDMLGFEIPRHFTPEKLTEEILNLAVKNKHDKAARIRLQIIRGNGGLYDAASHAPHYIIQTWELPKGNGGWNSNGLVLGIYTAAKKTCDAFSNLKHNNYLPYAMAALYAKKEKWNDALLLNSHERICDSSIANVFIIKNNEVLTPSLAEGCVAGVMRQHVINTLKQTAWKVNETVISVDDILNADEVFLTNSMYNIRWVQAIKNKKYINSISQKIYSLVVPTIE